MASILIIDDDVTFCLMLKTLLEKNHHEVTSVFSPVEAKRIIRERNFEVVLTDMRMPEISGLELIGLIKNQSQLTQIIMMTGYADITTAIKSIKQGAFDYIPKPLNPDEVLDVISNALRAGQQKTNNTNETPVFSPADFLDGVSSESRQLKEITGLVAPTSMSVLISGESGTGKEYIARFIHQHSKRSRFPFVAVDCGAIPKELAASEFFGHVKGSFTGAIADKTGQFEAANGGTLFLDEIENLAYDIQIQLLRALQEPMIKPVGGSKEITVDVRIISATNEDLSEAMERGNFRKDLYHRLNEFQLSVPPLRSRKQDIMIFAHHFLNQANSNLDKTVLGFDKSIEPVFMDYYWPGNLRELKNIVQRATLLAKGEYITIREIPPDLYEQSILEGNSGKSNHNNEPELIRKALEASEYNKSKAARLLNIDRKTLYNKLKHYNIFASGNN
ncbi:MAG TPA: sigma-54 dependent transcriptional regulator [Bacteroidales bacterium]|nr:sigma-54 dependent transcriptional regulator [Bacteroidales bacterium]